MKSLIVSIFIMISLEIVKSERLQVQLYSPNKALVLFFRIHNYTHKPFEIDLESQYTYFLSNSFKKDTKTDKDPYFTGEYQETPSTTEDGMQESDFTLTGWHRGNLLDLETAKEKIENYFYRDGRTTIAPNGNAVVVSYSHSFVIPSGDAELQKIEIHLNVKEWKVT